MEELTLFDFMEDGEKYKPIKSTDWKWTFADYPKEKNGLKVFSCFACGGGSTMGYKLAGCEVLGCCEIDPKMNEVYVKNHNPKYNFLTDIRKFNQTPDDELPGELFNLDILDGSPPCTTFSMAGEREDSWGKKKKFREGQAEQTLDDLSFVFIETVKKLRPRVMIMENVEGLLLGEAWGYVQKIYTNLGEIGYTVKHWLCKGERMGVPQTRHRVFFVAVRNDFDLDKVDMSFNYEPIPYGEIKSGDGEQLNTETVIYQWLQRADVCDKRISDTVVRHGENEKLFNHRICWENRIMQTVAAGGEILRGKEKTRVSVEDILRAQTFPEDYDFHTLDRNFKNAVYICGMSVPPIMIKRIVTRLIEGGVFD